MFLLARKKAVYIINRIFLQYKRNFFLKHLYIYINYIVREKEKFFAPNWTWREMAEFKPCGGASSSSFYGVYGIIKSI